MTLTVNGLNVTSLPVGSNLTILCSAESSPPAQLQWAFRGNLVNKTGALLQLLRVTEDRSGSYSCLAFNNHTNTRNTITTHITISSEFSFYLLFLIAVITAFLFRFSIRFHLHPRFVSTGSERWAVNVSLLLLLLLTGFLLSPPGKLR